MRRNDAGEGVEGEIGGLGEHTKHRRLVPMRTGTEDEDVGALLHDPHYDTGAIPMSTPIGDNSCG